MQGLGRHLGSHFGAWEAASLHLGLLFWGGRVGGSLCLGLFSGYAANGRLRLEPLFATRTGTGSRPRSRTGAPASVAPQTCTQNWGFTAGPKVARRKAGSLPAVMQGRMGPLLEACPPNPNLACKFPSGARGTSIEERERPGTRSVAGAEGTNCARNSPSPLGPPLTEPFRIPAQHEQAGRTTPSLRPPLKPRSRNARLALAPRHLLEVATRA